MADTQEQWDDFVARSGGDFLQSGEWGQFQKALGRAVRRIEGVGQFVKMPLPAGTHYWYCPRGPLQRGGFPKDGVFVRIEPISEALIPKGAIKVADNQPSHTLMLDLSKSEEELLHEMHPKWRYNIGLAERKGVHVVILSEAKDLLRMQVSDRRSDFQHLGIQKSPTFVGDPSVASLPQDDKAQNAFLSLMQETAARDQFSPHPRSYYETLLTSLGERGTLAIAEHEGDILAAHFLVRFHDTMTYLFGASSSKKRNLMAPHLLQWESIRYARAQGLKRYDFFGISDTKKSWAGLTRFKRGFGGYEATYPGTFDIPLKKSIYRVYSAAKKIRRKPH